MSDSGPAFRRYRSATEIGQAGPEAALSHGRAMASEIHRLTKTLPKLFDGVRRQADELRNKTRPSTKILFYGATGAGKSTLINAILGVKLLPTSGAGACTPCPIEVVYHQQETYVAVLTFSSREACEENVQDLLDYVEDHGDLHFTGDLQQTFRDVQSIAPSILHWLGEVPLPTAKAIVNRLPKSVQDLLGKTKTLIAPLDRPEIMKAKLEQYFWSEVPTDPAIAAALLEGPGVPMSSIIDHVLVRCHRHVLKNNLILQDLPGTGDANHRRHDAARDYFQHADFIWVVASMTRAADDAAVRKLWQDASRASKKQLLMDGKISKSKAPTVIITRADDFEETSMISKFKLGNELTAVYTSWQRKNAQVKKAIQAAKATRTDAHHAEAFRLADEERTVRCELRSRVLRGFTPKLASLLQDVYREDVRVDLSDDTRGDGGDIAPPDVFCVSATQHLAAVHQPEEFYFAHVDDTGIPPLINYCQKAASADRDDVIEGYLTSLEKLGRQLCTLADGVKDASTVARVSLARYVENHSIDVLMQNEWRDCKEALEADLKRHIKQPLYTKLAVGAETARELAMTTAREFALTKSVEHPDKIHWATFRAVLRHNGVFHGHDLNEQLIGPLTDHVAASWARTFGDSMAKRFPRFQTRATKALHTYMTGVRDHLKGEGHEPVYTLVKDIRRTAKHGITSAFASSLASIQARQKKVSRSMWLKTRTKMAPAYLVAQSRKGAGSIRSIKNQFREHVEDVHTTLFTDIVDDVEGDLDSGATHAGNLVSRGLKSVSEQIAQDFRTICAEPGPRTSREMITCQGVGNEVIRQVTFWREARRAQAHDSGTREEDDEDSGEPMDVDD